MAIEDALMALRQHWDDVEPRLDAAQNARLRALIAGLGGPDHAAAAAHIGDLLVDTLPTDHAVRRALADGFMLAPATIDLAAISLDLLAKAAGTGHIDTGTPSPGWILRSVVARLLSEPALTEQEVRRRGADPADPGLIRLAREDGGSQWPDFQFAPGGGPLPVVRAVNQVLDAAADPVGTADWWLSRNGWLDDTPSRLIGQVPDEVLVRAARAVRSGV
jgi:hypothetical protein